MPPGARPAILRSMMSALEKPCARNKTQAAQTKIYVANQQQNRTLMDLLGSRPMRTRWVLQEWLTANPRPCTAPQHTKVQLAPCQRPLSKKVMPDLRQFSTDFLAFI